MRLLRVGRCCRGRTVAVDNGICVIVSGGRDYAEIDRLWRLLDNIHDIRHIGLLCHGACKYGGADIHAENWAKAREVNYLGMPAKFKHRGPSAGPERNALLLKHCTPDMVLCFPGGKGTADMLKKAQKAGIWTIDLSKQYSIHRRKLLALGRE